MQSRTVKELEKIASQIRVCTKCPLHKGRTNAVPGEGNPFADIMFVGEGPGRREDELGRPFVGAAGKFLDELLASIHIERGEVFIGNVVKCRPPGNRDPEELEITTCTSLYLLRQVELINAKLIIPLGRHAMGYFLPNTLKISQVHGQAFRRNGRVYYPVYHPASALYNTGLRAVLLKDFRRIPKLLEKIKKEA